MSRLRSDPLRAGLGILTVLTVAVAAAIVSTGFFASASSVQSSSPVVVVEVVAQVMLRASAAAAALLALALLQKSQGFHGRAWLVTMLFALGGTLLLTSYGPAGPVGDGASPGRFWRFFTGAGMSAVGIVAISSALFAVKFPQPTGPQHLRRLLSSGQTPSWPGFLIGRRHAGVAVWILAHGGVAVPIIATALFVVGMSLSFRPWGLLAAVTAFVVPTIWSVQILISKYRDSGSVDLDRRSTLWVVLGFAIGLWLWYPIAGVTQVVFPDAMRTAWMESVLAGGQAAMLMCLYVAAFWAGTFDPALAVRRSTAYGTLGMVVVFVAALIEEISSDLLVSWFGLPGGWSVWITAALVAVIVSYVHRRYSDLLEKAFDRIAARSKDP